MRERSGNGNSFLGMLKERFLDRLSPQLLRSRLLWETVEALSRSPLNRTQWKADRISLNFFIRQTRDAYLGRKPVVWCNLLVPSELVHASGCVPFFPEMAAAVIASAGLAPRFIDRAAEEGFSTDACSYHRCLLGAALEDMLPRPHALLSVNYPCDSAILSFRYLSRLYRVPHLALEVPLSHHPQRRELLAEGMREVGLSLASLAGKGERELKEGLEKTIELSNQALEHQLELERLRQETDCLLDGRDVMGYVSVMVACMGTEEGVDFYRTLLREVRERGTAGDGAVRLMWMHLKPWYQQGIFDTVASHGARVVCEEYTHAYWDKMDPRHPYKSLAEKTSGHFLVGEAERRIGHLLQKAEAYRVQGAIHYNHWGCRQSCGAAQSIRRRFQEKGIPVLIIEGDCVDDREYQEGQILTRLEAFLESLKERPVNR